MRSRALVSSAFQFGLILLPFMAAPPVARAQFTYVTNNGALTITGYNGPGGEVIIPATINGLPVTTIGDSVFSGDYSITSVVVPEGVLSVENNAFSDCGNLTNVVLPATLQNIGPGVLSGCLNLCEALIPGNVTNIGDWAFGGCSSLTTVTIPDSVVSIGNWAFSQSYITNVTIGRGATTLGDYAFWECEGLGNVFFRGDAPQCGVDAFVSAGNTKVYYLPGTSGWGSRFCGWQTALWYLPHPIILNAGRTSGVPTNSFGFVVSWATNAMVIIEATSRVGTSPWLVVSTNVLHAGSSYFNDPGSADYPSRFYRVRGGIPSTRIIRNDWGADFRSTRVGDSAFKSITISNAGNSVLIVSNIMYPDGFSGEWSGTIPSHGSQHVQVAFSPTTQQMYGGPAYIISDATPGGDGIIYLSGRGYFPVNSWTLWWQNTNGETALWQMNGTNVVLASRLNPTFPGTGWHIVGTADFNGDNQDDLLFENTDGRVAAWLMSGTNRLSASYLNPSRADPGWHAMATGDLNYDGQKDILWQRDDGSVAVWLMNGLVATQSLRLNPATAEPGWRIVGTGDFNGDGKADILWQNAAGHVAVWLMDGVNRTSKASLNSAYSGGVWVVGTKDFNGDGYPGIIWQYVQGSSLSLVYWQLNNTDVVNVQAFSHNTVNPSWTVVGPR